jgi:hypothetical protein
VVKKALAGASAGLRNPFAKPSNPPTGRTRNEKAVGEGHTGLGNPKQDLKNLPTAKAESERVIARNG